jgi:ring-1,2-phenylacetyl-CoA epoxidase subunit PaaC
MDVACILHLADNALVLGQRNAEWCGHAPLLEEDIAMANISLDMIGLARMLYQLAAQREGKHEDHYAYWRSEAEFRNFTLCELPHSAQALSGNSRTERDYAVTIVRNTLYGAYALLQWQALEHDADGDVAAIAAKSVKEARYHLRHASDWLLRLGDGTDESHARMQRALNHLWPYTAEFWHTDWQQVNSRVSPQAWQSIVLPLITEATLTLPGDVTALTTTPAPFMAARGSRGMHSEHMGYLLAELQSVARAHPGAQW